MARTSGQAMSSWLVRRLSTAALTVTKNKKSISTTSSSSLIVKEEKKSSELYKRLSVLGGRNDMNVGETLNEWAKEGKSVNKKEIIGFVYQLRKYKKYNHAIQLLEWLDKRGQTLSYANQAVHLDLIAKAKGIDSAEKYFTSLPESSKNKLTYGALLNCYCQEKMTKKAMDLLEKMKEQNLASTCLAYNNIISLHMRSGEPEKVPLLVQEMKEKKITTNIYTYAFLMSSYALLKDIESAGRVIEEMKTDGISRNWSIYANLASIYVKEGNFDQANVTLKQMEKRMDVRDRKAYYILIGLYSHTSNKLGVDRVWDSLKSAFPELTNMCYLSKLQALHRLGDTDGLKKCFDDWESGCSNYDIKLVNVLIDSYLSRGMIPEAEALLERAVRKVGKASFRTLEMFMNFYLEKRQLDSALKYLKTAASMKNEYEWKPSQDVVDMFLRYLEEEKNVDGAENLFKSLKKLNSVSTEVYDSLLRTYVAAGIKDPEMHKRMKEDGIEASPSSKTLIGKVCL
ncbi:hypothetical protein IFM89_018435 [Coptis chinensis]|uniref:Pentatricopeptide repeat-containing protein n=1 Tax=Coptis chinensis TaxID=261450 RepID=A0A835LWG4_9MAGN|nr:hypothetical protein IFM89_018435 [Coptis chinensis]